MNLYIYKYKYKCLIILCFSLCTVLNKYRNTKIRYLRDLGE